MVPELIRGGGGIFDVHVGDELVYSKFTSGGFPDATRLVKKLQQG